MRKDVTQCLTLIITQDAQNIFRKSLMNEAKCVITIYLHLVITKQKTRKTQNKNASSAYKNCAILSILSANERSILCGPEFWETPKSKIFI